MIFEILTFVILEVRRGKWFKLRLLDDGNAIVAIPVHWRLGKTREDTGPRGGHLAIRPDAGIHDGEGRPARRLIHEEA